MDKKQFEKGLKEGDIHLECQLCGALMWIAHADGQLHLMRQAVIPHPDCPICDEIHEMIS